MAYNISKTIPQAPCESAGNIKGLTGPSLISHDTRKDRGPHCKNSRARNIMVNNSGLPPDQEILGQRPQLHSGAWKKSTKDLKQDQSGPSGPGVDGLRLQKIRIGPPDSLTLPRMIMDIHQLKTGLIMSWNTSLGYPQAKTEEQVQVHSEAQYKSGNGIK